jgi:hypothetical protein
MPDLKGREKYEDKVAAALLLSWREPRKTALSGSEPDWRRMEAAIVDNVDPILREVALMAAMLMLQDAAGLTAVPKRFDGKVGTLVGRSAKLLAKRVVKTRKDSWRSMEPFDWQRDELGLDRASAVGVTEVTNAISLGEEAAKDWIETTEGSKLIAIWNIDPRSNVCKICLPLDGKTSAVWGADFPLGPPAHPNCRCFKTFRPARFGESVLVGWVDVGGKRHPPEFIREATGADVLTPLLEIYGERIREGWITINTDENGEGGQKVYVDGSGVMQSGPFSGKTFAQAFRPGGAADKKQAAAKAASPKKSPETPSAVGPAPEPKEAPKSPEPAAPASTQGIGGKHTVGGKPIEKSVLDAALKDQKTRLDLLATSDDPKALASADGQGVESLSR